MSEDEALTARLNNSMECSPALSVLADDAMDVSPQPPVTPPDPMPSCPQWRSAQTMMTSQRFHHLTFSCADCFHTWEEQRPPPPTAVDS
jgi:hypothetical protein